MEGQAPQNKPSKWRITLEQPLLNEPLYTWVDKKTELLIVRVGNEIRAFQSLCPHMGAQLQWNAKENKITCPWHGLAFNADSLCSAHPQFRKIQGFRAEIDNNVIEIYETESN